MICLLLVVVISISCYYFYRRGWIKTSTHYGFFQMYGLKEIENKNCSYIFDDIINVESLNPNKLKADDIPIKMFLFTALDM